MTDQTLDNEYRDVTNTLAEALQKMEVFFLDYNIPFPNWYDAAKWTVAEMQAELRSMEKTQENSDN